MKTVPPNPLLTVLLPVCCVLLLGAASTARARVEVDIKIFSAVNCTQFAGPADAVMLDYSGSLLNTHPSRSARVNCPILRDRMSSGAGIHNVHAHVADAKGSWCRLHLVQPANNEAGRVVHSTVLDASPQSLGAGSGYRLLLFNMIDATGLGAEDVVPRNYRVYYTMQCKLDPGTRLISIRTVESKP